MESPQSSLQLNMNFSGENPLAACLREGEFFLLIECNTPPLEQPFETSLTLSRSIARKIGNFPEVVGMAVTDRLRSEDTHDPVETAARLAEASGKPPLLYLSGKGSSEGRIRELLARARSAGIRSVVAVTGDRSEKHTASRSGTRVAPYPAGYLDSVDILELGRASGDDLCMGAGINPYKYNPADQYLQYFKMMRKLDAGAEFLVTQVGWDMKKLQELQWYLQMRDVGSPVIARLALLSVDDIARIHEGLYPGVHVARSFAAVLQRESNVNAAQSLSAQLHRLGLQVAGCRLLGYNGVQIAGLRDGHHLDMVLVRIGEALAAYDSFGKWVSAWNEFHNFMSFDPIPDAYYVFDGLLRGDTVRYDADTCQLTDRSLPEPGVGDRALRTVLSTLFGGGWPEAISESLAAAVERVCGVSREQLRECFFLSPSACPKRLIHGACGGSEPDGTCEFGHGRCFFQRVLALAAHSHELDSLEEGPKGDG